MAQFGFGMTTGPNGPQIGPVMMITPSTPAEPEAYETYMETPEGVCVKVTYHTANKVMADRYEDEILQKMGWKVISNPPAREMSKWQEVSLCWIFSFLAAFALPFFTFILVSILKSAGFVDRGAVDFIWDNGARIGIMTFFIVGFLLTILTLSCGDSKETQVER